MKRIKEPLHEKTDKMVCAPSKDSDQPRHLFSLSAQADLGAEVIFKGHVVDFVIRGWGGGGGLKLVPTGRSYFL